MIQRRETRADLNSESLQGELQRERQLVRSTGMISKQAIVCAFGVAFLLIAAAITATTHQSLLALSVGSVGALGIAWAVVSWFRRSRLHNPHSQ